MLDPGLTRDRPGPAPNTPQFLVFVSGVEHHVLIVAFGVDVGEQVEDLFPRQFIQQALRHEGGRGLCSFVDVRFLNRNRLGFGKRVDNHIDNVSRLLNHHAGDDFARVEQEVGCLEFIVDHG